MHLATCLSLKILGVSLDDNKERWINAIQADGLIWHHVSDLKKWQSAAGMAYGVGSIPFTVLVDRDGNIIAKGLRGESLEQKIKEAVSQKYFFIFRLSIFLFQQ